MRVVKGRNAGPNGDPYGRCYGEEAGHEGATECCKLGLGDAASEGETFEKLME